MNAPETPPPAVEPMRYPSLVTALVDLGQYMRGVSDRLTDKELDIGRGTAMFEPSVLGQELRDLGKKIAATADVVDPERATG